MIFNRLPLFGSVIAEKRVITDMPKIRIVVPVFGSETVAVPKIVLNADERLRPVLK